MNDVQRGVLTLIRSAIKGEPLPLPEGFSMEAAEQLILEHQVVGLAYAGAVQCGIAKTDPVMNRLFQRYLQIMMRSNAQMAALEALYAAFESAQIDYLPVKGCDLKKLYPHPAMRIMGDADVLIRMEQYDRIRQVMLELGYTEGEQTGHELVWDTNALHLELHKQLVSSYQQDLQNYFGDGWNPAVLRSGCRYGYSPEDHYLFIFAHFVKHYRRSGIGVRYVLDLLVYQQAYADMDWDYLRKELEKLQLWQFHTNMQKLIAFWFQDGEADERTTFISDYIFESGSWGTIERHQVFMGARRAKEVGSAQKAMRQRIFTALFPPLKKIKQEYPFMEKLPILLPFMWVVRWFDILLFRREKIRRSVQNTQNTTAGKIDAYQQALAYVGLNSPV